MRWGQATRIFFAENHEEARLLVAGTEVLWWRRNFRGVIITWTLLKNSVDEVWDTDDKTLLSVWESGK